MRDVILTRCRQKLQIYIEHQSLNYIPKQSGLSDWEIIDGLDNVRSTPRKLSTTDREDVYEIALKYLQSP